MPNEFINFDDENTDDVEASVQCNTANDEFEFLGCYPNGEISVTEHARYLIKNKSVLHLDASNGVDTHENTSHVKTWTSAVNKNNKTYTMSRVSPDNQFHPTIVDNNGAKSIVFPGNSGQKLTHTNFNELADVEKYQRYFFYKPYKVKKFAGCIMMA